MIKNLLLATNAEERSWLKELIISHFDNNKNKINDFDLLRSYANAFHVDFPEIDDEHYLESLIEGLIQAEKYFEEINLSHDFFHKLIEILVNGMGLNQVICKMEKNLISSYGRIYFERSLGLLESDKKLNRNYINKVDLDFSDNLNDHCEFVIPKQSIDWWPDRFSGERPNPENTVTRFIKNLYLENKRLEWSEFLNSLVPARPNQSHRLCDYLKEMHCKPLVYWYPGSGSDFNPIVDRSCNYPYFDKLLKIDGSSPVQNPMIFWMNDLRDIFDIKNKKIFEDSKFSISENYECYIFNDVIPLTLFSIRIHDRHRGVRGVAKNDIEYLILFSKIPSHVLFSEVFFPARLNVACALLAAQGGFSGQLLGFEQYRDIPKLLTLTENELGPVDAYYLDRYAHDKLLRRPKSPYIRSYEESEISLSSGWTPCKAFTRPGFSYKYENLSTWRSIR